MSLHQPNPKTTEAEPRISEQAGQPHETAISEYLKARVSRTQLLAGMGAGLAAVLLPGMAAADGATPGSPRVLSFPFFPKAKGTYTTEAIADILNVLVTAAYLRATFVTANIAAGRVVPIPNEPAGSQLALRIAQADAAIEQYHIDLRRFSSACCHLPTSHGTPRPSPEGSELRLVSTSAKHVQAEISPSQRAHQTVMIGAFSHHLPSVQ